MSSLYKERNNNYDYGIIIIISLLIFGNLGGSLQPIRVVSLLLLPKAIKYSNTAYVKRISRFLLFLYLYICFSLYWTSDFNEGIKEVVYYLSHFSLFLLIAIFFFKANNPIESLLRGWFIFILLTQIIALTEIFFDIHMSTSFLESDRMMNVGGLIVQKKFASVTFGNYNTYTMVIAMALPFLFAHLNHFTTLKTQIASIIVISFSYFISFINASRGGIIAGVIILIIFLFFSRKKKINHLKVKMLLIVPIAFFFIYKYAAIIFEQLFFRMSGGASFTEDLSRFRLFNAAIDAFNKKPFFGGGVGSLQLEMQDAFIAQPHNLILEFLVQFGLIATFVFVLFLIRIVLKSKSCFLDSKYILYAIIFSFPVISIINSGYLLHPVLWVYLASIYCIARKKLIQNSIFLDITYD